MNQEEKEIFLLKKRLENRESTISFLNEIIEAQSKSIDELKEKNHLFCEEIRRQDEKIRRLEEVNGQIVLYKELVRNLTKSNDELKSKLDILFNAFNTVRSQDQENVQNNKSNEKSKHDNELLSPQWRKKREEVFEKYGKQCVECGSTSNVQVHHLVYRKGRHIWEYDVDELIPLCKECHQKIHDDKNHTLHEKYIN